MRLSSPLHRCLWLAVATLLFALLPSMASAASWTVLVYLNGDNDLDDPPYLFDVRDINEMELAPTNANVNVVVQIDRWTHNGQWSDTRRYLIRHDTNPNVIASTRLDDPPLGELDMGNPQTLIDFVEWGKQHYPADHYLVDIWDHGAGWKALNQKQIPWKGVSYDYTSGSDISTTELGTALRTIAGAIGKKVDILAIDACLMQMAEIGYEIKDGADYYVTSEETIPGYGFPYDKFLTALAGNPSMSPAQLCQILVQTYCDSYSPGGSQYDGWPMDVCLSAVDLSKIGDVEAAVDSFAVAASNAMSTSCEQLLPALEQSQLFFDSDYHDLYDMASRAQGVPDTGLQSAAAQVTAAVTAAVIANQYVGESQAGAHGISIYYPPASGYLPDYGSLAFAASNHWDEFISTRPPCAGGHDDAYEPDNTPQQATTLLSGHTQANHWFSSDTDLDWAKVTMTAGKTYLIETQSLGADCDTVLALFTSAVLTNPNVDPLALNDDIDYPNGILASRIVWDATASGDYYIVAFGYPGVSGPAMNYDLFFSEVSFDDVWWDYWAFGFIEAAVSASVVQGFNGNYNPTGVVTRDQMAVYVARALAGGDAGVTTPTGAPTFTDVGADHWAYKYIEYTVGRGVVTGYPNGTYQPTTEVDRGQMAVFIARSMANPPGDVGLAGYLPPAAPTFADVTAGNDWSWALKYVEYIASQQVSGGYPDGLYHPDYTVTRDQMAVYIARAFHLMD